ncbi:ubiquinone/menaquinone biosynthesis C-methylase UbiE [Allocatelliglobosispora scoriae]|uniref:Ubiquinone/menaquinone biosynthesis C-methylase UbiE n=1 Tax=Allocatelliglobosispora scoriae TaxID=643052 RepID=A0A841C105_9ACTN|nr:class I SAM-dependent methyltransferase [Allocatelliglobosispora scoriae]MBB5873546.1 ubiquinone/menaquinone biosynthesis C-methylase UbiE [Allocatelliglobosispora scoriae]
MTSTIIDFETIKKAQRAGWETGDYPRVGNTLQIIAELLVEAADVRAGQRVLDVACGQGNAAMAAARRFAVATGVDYAVNLLQQGRERAAAEHLPVTFTEGDAEQLPLADGSFDLTLSTVGVMFAPDHQRAADELVRVTAPGGTIALASWTPTGMVGRLFRTVGRWAPPPAGVRPATQWGTADHLAELFGDRVEWTGLVEREFTFCYHSPEHFSQWFRDHYGPITRLSGTLNADDLASFAADLADVAREFNRADDGTVAAPSTYLEAVGRRR